MLLLQLPLLVLSPILPLLLLLLLLRAIVCLCIVLAGEGPSQRQHYDGCQWPPHPHRLWLHAQQHTR
jgi:hypothetical protein